MRYTQLFQQLYYQADVVHGGRLPVHVHFVMDEFANVALPDEFNKLLATMRSREISVSISISLYSRVLCGRRLCHFVAAECVTGWPPNTALMAVYVDNLQRKRFSGKA